MRARVRVSCVLVERTGQLSVCKLGEEQFAQLASYVVAEELELGQVELREHIALQLQQRAGVLDGVGGRVDEVTHEHLLDRRQPPVQFELDLDPRLPRQLLRLSGVLDGVLTAADAARPPDEPTQPKRRVFLNGEKINFNLYFKSK